jgi:hypothetical protein
MIETWVSDVATAYEQMDAGERPAVAAFLDRLAGIAERHTEQAVREHPEVPRGIGGGRGAAPPAAEPRHLGSARR